MLKAVLEEAPTWSHFTSVPRSESGECSAVATESPFGEIIVQSGVTSSILNAVVAQELPGPGTVFLQLDLSFFAPVRLEDTTVGEVEIVEVRPDKPITKLDVTVTRDDGMVALLGTAVCYTAPSPGQT